MGLTTSAHVCYVEPACTSDVDGIPVFLTAMIRRVFTRRLRLIVQRRTTLVHCVSFGRLFDIHLVSPTRTGHDEAGPQAWLPGRSLTNNA